MEKERVLVYKMSDFTAMKAMVEELDAKYNRECQEVGLFRRMSKYLVRVTARADESTLEQIEAVMQKYGIYADLNLTSLIRESESMLADSGFEYIRKGGIL